MFFQVTVSILKQTNKMKKYIFKGQKVNYLTIANFYNTVCFKIFIT